METENHSVYPPPTGTSLSELLKVQKTLLQRGFYLKDNCDKPTFDRISKSLGKIISEQIVQCNPNKEFGLDSNKRMKLHNDHPSADYIGWYCVAQADSGGESILLNFHDVLPRLDAETHENLKSVKVKIPCAIGRYWDSTSLIQRNGGCYFVPWLIDRPSLTYSQIQSLEQLREQLKSQRKVFLKLAPGSALFINNKWILHGRSELLEGACNRRLIRHWISKMSYESLDL